MGHYLSPTVRVLRQLLGDTEQAQWGHQLSKDARVSPGTIYGILNRLADNGWLTELEEPLDEPAPRRDGKRSTYRPPRRLYRLTEKGEEEARRAVDKALYELQQTINMERAAGHAVEVWSGDGNPGVDRQRVAGDGEARDCRGNPGFAGR